MRSRSWQLGKHIQQEITQGITEYINGLLPDIPDPMVRDKAKLVLDDPNGFSMLYYDIFPEKQDC